VLKAKRLPAKARPLPKATLPPAATATLIKKIVR